MGLEGCVQAGLTSIPIGGQNTSPVPYMTADDTILRFRFGFGLSAKGHLRHPLRVHNVPFIVWLLE